MADTEKVMIPSLRFPDFDNEWKVQLLSELANFRNGKAHEQAISKNGDYVVINSKFISTEGKVRKFSDSQIAPVAAGEITMVMSDIPKGRALAKCYHVEANNVYTLNQRICALSATNSYGKFLFFRINRNRYFLEFDSGVGQTNLRKDEVLDCPLRCPETLPEQKKIADFLTSVDERIGQLIKKKALLEDYKKGVMQQLFSQQIRFKDDNGNDFPDWEEKKLGELGQFKTSSVDKKIVEGERLVRLVNYMNVYRHEEINNQTVSSYMEVSAKDNQIETSDLKAGDILFTPSSETSDDIGHSVVILEDLANTVYSYHLMRFRPKVKLDINYSHYFCNTSEVLKQISKAATGSTRFTVSVTEFSKIRVKVPPVPEQKKIADFLSSIDQKIESISQQIARTQTFKKGLLQQMFV